MRRLPQAVMAGREAGRGAMSQEMRDWCVFFTVMFAGAVAIILSLTLAVWLNGPMSTPIRKTTFTITSEGGK